MLEVPPEITPESFREAGFRCFHYLRNAEAGGVRTPVIFYSISLFQGFPKLLSGHGIPYSNHKGVAFVNKGADQAVRRLDEKIEKLLSM
jgi:hypothetical protein